jgi:hypothetical protein
MISCFNEDLQRTELACCRAAKKTNDASDDYFEEVVNVYEFAAGIRIPGLVD